MKDSGKIVNISFDVDNIIIDAPCPDCLLDELKDERYKNLMLMLNIALVEMDDYYKEKKCQVEEK